MPLTLPQRTKVAKPTTFTPVSKTVTQPTTHSSSATGLVKTLKGECTNKLFMKIEDKTSIITKLFHFSYYIYFLFFLAFDFCRFCVVIQFFHPRHSDQWPPTWKDLLSQIIFLSYFLRKRQYFPFNVECQTRRTTDTIFNMTLVWCGPCRGIEPVLLYNIKEF